MAAAAPPLKWPGHRYQAVGGGPANHAYPQTPFDPEQEPEPASAQTWTPTPTSAASELPPNYAPADPGPIHPTAPILTDAKLPWRPFYLRRRILLCFTAVFALVIAAIETLLVFSDRNNGITSSSSDQHYLWTYGPTAFLTLVAAAWSRSEHQSKLVAPWVRLWRHPARPERTLLLDYLSDFQLYAVFKALRNRDFAVSITSTVAILIKVLIVISTGLITLTWTQVRHPSWPLTVQDRFVSNPARLSNSGTLVYYVMQGLADRNLTYPNGIFTEYAFQSIQDDLPDTAETSVTVDGFENSLECQPAEVALRGSMPPDPHYPHHVMNLTITSPGCNIQDFRIAPSPRWTCGNNSTCDALFSRFVPAQCDGVTDDTGKRVLVMFGNLTYTVDYSKTEKDYTGAGTLHPLIARLHQSAQMLCVPTYGITKVDVVRNGTQTRSVTAIPGITSRNLDSISAWDLMDAHYAAFKTFILIAYGKTTEVSQTTVDVDQRMELALRTQLAPDQPVTSLLDPKSLQQLATGYYRQVAAIIAKQTLMEPASVQKHGSVVMWDNRLVIRNWAAQWMAGMAAVCVVLTAAATFLVPSRGILPCSPATLPGMALLVGHSPDLLAMLRLSGAADTKSLGRPLLTSTFRSGVVADPTSSQPHFTILSELHSDRKSLTFPQVISKHSHPGVLHPGFRLALCLLLTLLIIALELTLRKSNHDDGLGDAGDDTYIHYTWTAVPAVAFGALSMLFSTMDFQIRSLAPYTALKQTVTAKTYLTLDFMDMSIPRTIFREIKFANIGALAATTAFLVASVFTIFSASLFQPLAVATTIPVTLRANQSFAMNQMGSKDGNVIASLIFGSNFSYPMFTYDDLAFPQLVSTVSLPADGSVNASTVSIEAVVPAVRARLHCRVYDSSKISTNLTLDYTIPYSFHNPLGINIEGEECNHFPKYEAWGYSNILPTYPNMTYFGLGNVVSNVSQTQGCSNLLYTWGKLDYTADPIIQHIAAIGCNESIETLSVSTTFRGANLTIDDRDPPVPLENTTRPSTIVDDGLWRVYTDLAYLTTVPNYLQPFFAMLTSSPWAVPLSSLGDPLATETILKAIKHHHGIIQAQNFAQNMAPANGTNTTLPVDITGSSTATDDQFVYEGKATTPQGEGRRRVVQDAASTRVLQALLASAVVLVAVGWAFMRETDVLPRRPTTIASVVALLAGGNLFEGRDRDGYGLGVDNEREDGSDGGGEEEKGLGPRMSGARFWMGWGTVTDWEGREVGGGENEGGVSRFGIFAVREEEVKEGDDEEGERGLIGG
ncbi:hypothetical protein C8A01DRAFT_19546 [Parachaetomium inaequale]|uniref:Uncharacterized protein n=1 Tax=Parachaetomium inaequale TaxID=2588326 RepID=A0AAN6P855_9PEZI|nr:hypothetical protein C8A01DRAFT_19546 [Parachaetomium inaequale]